MAQIDYCPITEGACLEQSIKPEGLHCQPPGPLSLGCDIIQSLHQACSSCNL